MSADISFELVNPSEEVNLQHHRGPDLSSFPPAGNGRRFLAFLIDAVISGGFVKLAMIGLLLIHVAPLITLILVSFADILLYWVGPTYLSGQTLGKKIMGIRVVTKISSDDLGMAQLLVRETVGKALGSMIFLLGYLWIFFNPDHRGWHDFISGTKVIEVTSG